MKKKPEVSKIINEHEGTATGSITIKGLWDTINNCVLTR